MKPALLWVCACPVVALAGCGINLGTSVRNVSDRSLRAEFVDVYAGARGSSVETLPAWLTVDVEPGTTAEFTVRDGARAEEKYLRIVSPDTERPLDPLIAKLAGFWSFDPVHLSVGVRDGRVVRVDHVE